MKVFNLYKKLFKSKFVVVIIYVSIFLGLSIVLSSSQSSSNAFVETRIGVSLVNLDEDSKLSNGLIDYLSKYAVYKDIPAEDIDDALYFKQISVIITIPKNLEEDLIMGRDIKIQQRKIEENITTVAIDRAINKYLNYVSTYLNNTDKTIEEVVLLVSDVLEKEAEAITLIEESDQLDSSAAYFRIFSYIVMSVILTVVGLITISYRKFEVNRRLIVSPYPTKNASLDMIFGNLLFTIALVTLLCGVSVLLYPDVLFSKNGLLLLINAYLFGFAALSMSYFMSLLIRKEEVLSGVNNVFSLGTAFLTGAFVPQFLLSSGILAFAHIFPSYYYVYNVEKITSTGNLGNADINSIIIHLLVQIVFIGLFVVASIILSRKQMQSEN
ncbi:MAG: ABC transporter permease [Bacilli bacterium]|nr:ABC transporter permease [Bacilli bacterium]